MKGTSHRDGAVGTGQVIGQEAWNPILTREVRTSLIVCVLSQGILFGTSDGGKGR